MALRIVCPSCEHSFPLPPERTGAEVTCPQCDRRFDVELEGRYEHAPIVDRPTRNPSPVRFTFACTGCGSILEATQSLCGHSGRCPTCGGVIIIPDFDPLTGLKSRPPRAASDGQLPTPMHAYASAGSRAPKIKRLPDGSAVIVCPRCAHEMPVEADLCAACGNPFTIEGATSTARLAPGSNRCAEWSLFMGVLAVPTFCLPLIGVAAVCTGIVGVRRAHRMGPAAPGRMMSITGMILGLVSIGLFIYFRFF